MKKEERDEDKKRSRRNTKSRGEEKVEEERNKLRIREVEVMNMKYLLPFSLVLNCQLATCKILSGCSLHQHQRLLTDLRTIRELSTVDHA